MKKITLLFMFLITIQSFGQVIITELADPNNESGARYVELYNAGSSDFDLTGYELIRWTNGNANPQSSGVDLSSIGLLPAGSFVIVAADSADFSSIFGFAPDIEAGTGGPADSNGDDQIALTDGSGSIVDIFGVPGEDGSGTCHEFEDGRAERVASSIAPASTWIESNWNVWADDTITGCTSHTDQAQDAPGIFDPGAWIGENNSCTVAFGLASYVCNSNTIGDNNDTVTINIPYSGSNNTIVNLTASNGTIGGDDPALTADGTITISGLQEGDAWSVTLNGGDCDGTSVSDTVPASECDPTPNTCFDLSTGAELFELVTVTPNSGFTNNGTWEQNGGTYSANGFCGGGCEELVESWLIFGPLDMSGVSDLELMFDASENFGVTDLVVAYTASYSGCPSSTSWTTAQTVTGAGLIEVDLSAASGTDVFIGIQYLDDGTDGYSGWDLSNVSLAAFGNCPILGQRPTSNCAVCDLTLETENFVCMSNTPGDDNDNVMIEVPYTGVENTITSVTSTSATVGGDDPSSVTDGVITLTGLSEGDAWDLTINGGDCDGTMLSGTVPSAACDPTTNDLVINEILADPAPDLAGDANGDGTRDGSQDEFIELYNLGSSSLDLSGFTIDDGFGLRHTFPANTILPANTFITVFGGGTPTGISGLVQVASTGGLGLNNGGDDIVIKNAAGNTVINFTYSGASDQSIGRNPDFTGDFADHSTIPGNNGALFSPNLENDDSTLSSNTFNIGSIDIYPNPVKNGFVTISIQNSSSFNVEIYNILGKRVLTQSAEASTQLNVSNLKAGVYLVKITEGNQSLTKKLIIQ